MDADFHVIKDATQQPSRETRGQNVFTGTGVCTKIARPHPQLLQPSFCALDETVDESLLESLLTLVQLPGC